MAGDDDLVRGLVQALTRSIDPDRLRQELRAKICDGQEPAAAKEEGGEAMSDSKGVASKVLERFAMADVLDASILGARPGDTSFPLRLFFGSLSERADEETAYALGSGLNFYFRVPMDEDAKTRVALEVSRLYYRFADETEMDDKLRRELSPLLAKLLSTQLERVRLETQDHVPVFDSSLHERGEGSNATSGAVKGPVTFLCRVVGNERVRHKAIVRT